MLEFYTADVTGKQNNTRYPNKVEVTDSSSLRKAVSRDYVCAEYKDYCRSNKNFVHSNCLAFDVDNDESDDASTWITPEKITNVFQDVTVAFHFSRNHMIDKNYVDEATGTVTKTVTARPRFHVFFEITPVSDYAEYKKLKEKVISLFPYFDKGAMDSARFFYGTENPSVSFSYGTITLNEFLFPGDFDKELSKIKVGSRNNTLSHFAGKVLKRYGDTDEAYQLFLDMNNNCEAPLDDTELAAIWNSALRFFRNTVSKDPGYIPAAEYNALKDVETDGIVWDEPLPLEGDKLPEFPIEALPPSLANYAADVAKSTQTPVDMAAVAALTTVSACMRNFYKVEGKSDWLEPTNIYSVIVAEPSERKTAVISHIIKPVDSFIDEYNKNHKFDIEKSKVIKQRLENERNALTCKSKKKGEVAAADFDNELNSVISELMSFEEVKPLRIYVDDTTPEKLTETLAENDSAIAIISSEGGIFDVISGAYANRVNIDVFLKAYSGEKVSVDRIMRHSVFVDKACLTILLSVQPVVIAELMNNKQFRHRGLTARFLYTTPRSFMGTREFELTSISKASFQAYKEVIYNILAEKGKEEAEIIRLSDEAKTVFISYYYWVEKLLVGELSMYNDWLGKLVGNTLRIAGILARCSVMKNNGENEFLRINSPITIDKNIMENAIKIGRYFMAHAISSYGDMGIRSRFKAASVVLAKVKEKNLKSITRRVLMRHCQWIKTAEEAQDILNDLEDYGYVKLDAVDRSDKLRNGRPKNGVYAINPSVLR